MLVIVSLLPCIVLSRLGLFACLVLPFLPLVGLNILLSAFMFLLDMSIINFFHRRKEDEVASEVLSSLSVPSPLASASPAAIMQQAPCGSDDGDMAAQSESVRKRKLKGHQKFAAAVRPRTGLEIKPAPDMGGRAASQCVTCLQASTKTLIRNVLQRWVSHAKSCPGLRIERSKVLAPEAEAFVVRCRLGGDKHRLKTCDTLITTYWVYKHKLPFTTANKVKEVHSLTLMALTNPR